MKIIGVIGCGNMGSALLRGIRESRLAAGNRLIAWDADEKKLRRLARALGIRPARSNPELAQKAGVILLAVKPQQMAEVLEEMCPHLGHRPLLISVAAGISTRWIEKRAGTGIPVIRVMPNSPALIRCGISAIAPGRFAGGAMVRAARRIFERVGQVVEVPERWMDGVTALSGSGPAYFFFLMEQMIEAGASLGLAKEAARRLVLATAEGAARMAASSGESPALLRARVTSKGGTTEAAFRLFSQAGLGRTIQNGIRAAAARSREMGS